MVTYDTQDTLLTTTMLLATAYDVVTYDSQDTLLTASNCSLLLPTTWHSLPLYQVWNLRGPGQHVTWLSPLQVWNLRGLANNAWHRVPVVLEADDDGEDS